MRGCLSENQVQELVAGAVAGPALARAHRHIETCAACRTLVIELARDEDLEAGRAAPTSLAAAADARAPRVLAERFELLRPLGRGGMSVVYEAIDRERGARVALKTLQHASADGLLRLKTEFRALADVQHPNLVALGELLEDRGQWWLTMELVEGDSFLDHVRPGGRLDEGRLRAALPQLAAALHALHAHGLVHRDVKPHNVVVTAAGRVVLLDFGLVTSVDQRDSDVVGTPAYMAPEQAVLEEIGPAADWYGVGALLYEALTGVLPFQGASLQVLIAKQHALPRRPRELARVPDDLDALCMQLLAVAPAERLDAAAALARLDPGAAAPSPPITPAVARMFVGRRRELASLAEAFAGSRAGTEAVVLVQGESGIGKSALVEQLVEDLHRRAPAVLIVAGRCYEREAVPYKGVDGVVDQLARHLRKLPEADAVAVLPRRAGLLVRAFPVLGKVPALRDLPADDVIDPVELRTRAFTALRELLGRLAERCPLVVWIDDLHWADPDSLELLAWVMAAPEAPPLLLVLTTRPPRDASAATAAEVAMARLRELPRLRVLELQPLPRDEAVELAERLLAEAPAQAPASAATMADEAAGHPLFIEALARHTAIRPAPDRPLRLSDALWARIAELDAAARQLLVLCAVAGWPLSPDLLGAAAELPAGEIDPALARLRGAHLARVADGKGAVEPYHDRVREAVLDNLDPELRKACHRSLAEALLAAPPLPSSGAAAWSPEAVGVHLRAAGELDEAARHLMLAADQAAAALAFDRAARLYREALALHEEAGDAAAPLGDPRDVLARLAQALANACRGAEAAAVYFELARRAEAAGEDDLELRLRAAEQLLGSGHRDEGRRALAGVLDELALSPPATRAGAASRFLWRRARVRLRGFGSPARGGGAARPEPSPRELLRLEACKVALMSSDFPLEYATRYQVLALRTDDPRCIGRALTMELDVALLLRTAGPRRIARLMDELAAVAARSGDPFTLGQTEIFRAWLEGDRGQWARGREHAAQALYFFRERCLGASYWVAKTAVHHGAFMFYMGELRDLVRELLPLVREAEERADHFTLATLHTGVVGLISLLQDQPEAARQKIERWLAAWTAVVDIQRLGGQISQSEVDLYEGDGAAAYRRFDRDWRRNMAMPITRISILRARALSVHGMAALAAARSGGALDRRLVAVAARDARELRAMRRPWTCALARIVEAGVALAAGDRGEGRAQLERAHAELEAAGMRLHATLARRRLGELAGDAAGARAIAEADAWLAAQDVRAPGRLARLYMPEVP